ncbi:hypothetical protein AB0M11_02330 [Streptomyces sp. NPDC051987]|uniref:hypothetical protein n=1 Tax=Streptomyces sp. NPDC051987 TaxID=3155808 RepID=UPI003442190D
MHPNPTSAHPNTPYAYGADQAPAFAPDRDTSPRSSRTCAPGTDPSPDRGDAPRPVARPGRPGGVGPVDVFLSDDGAALIDGVPVFPEVGRPVQELVLDLLQRRAREREAPVGAWVHDRPGATRFLLEVCPDGSSRVLSTEQVEKAPAQTPAPAQAPVPLSAAARPLVPAALAAQLERLVDDVIVRELAQAYELAGALRKRLARDEGGAHPYVTEARALEAVLARLCHGRRQTVALALAAARVRCRGGDPRAADAVARAAAAWSALDDPRAVRDHGRELLELWDELRRRELLPPTHAGVVREIHRYLDAVVQQASTERGSRLGTLGPV